jgi:hypothetical protein
MTSRNKKLTSSTVATETPIPAFLVAHLLAPTDLATFANVSRHVHGEPRGFPLDLIYNHAEYYTQERLSALLIQPGYWKLTAVMIQARNSPPPSLRRLYLFNSTSLNIAVGLTLLEELCICNRLGRPSDFVFGQWASGLTTVVVLDPHLLVLPLLTHLPNIVFLDLTGCNQLQSVVSLVTCQSLTTLILNGCSALDKRALRHLTRLSALQELRIEASSTLQSVPPLD